MEKLINYKYWFNLRPEPPAGFTLKLALAFILILIILAAFTAVGKKRWSKGLYSVFWNNSYYFFLSNAIIGLFLLFFNYELVPFLSARFWLLLWVIIMVVWFIFIVKILFKIPQKKAKLEKEKEFKKYLP